MCGICGEYARRGGVSEEAVRRMNALLAHRGPDDENAYVCGDRRVVLAQRRLSVIDIEGGRQPMSNEDGSVWIVYNGEVYNFRELRDELEAKGHVFRTGSDTEVIVHLFEEEGEDCVRRLNGMFAFAVWDERGGRLFLARDRIGIKPLYYAESGGRFIFASEITPIVEALGSTPAIDTAALWSYLSVQYAPSPGTLFEGVRELPPGRRMTVDGDGARIDRYWELPEGGEPLAGRAAEEAVIELFEDSVKKRLVADVPLGAFLSGGVDSSAVVAFMSRHMSGELMTFSVDFEAELGAEAVNETEWSTLASKTFGTSHHRLTVSAADALDALPAVIERLDDLISDPAIIPTYLVSRFARRKVTVALSGEGGDELFGGYQRYRLAALGSWYRPFPAALRRILFELPASRLPRMRRVRKGIRALSMDSPARRHLAWLTVMPAELIDELIGPDTGGEERLLDVFSRCFAGQSNEYDLDRTLRTDLQTWLPDDLLTKVDRASMAVGLECRVPFLDHRLVELCQRIPAREKADLFRSKKILKRALAGIVPDPIIKRSKAGFTLPLDAWFRKELREMLTDYLSAERLTAQGLFDPGAVEGLVREHLSGRENQGHQLFSLLIFQMWRDSMKNRRAPEAPVINNVP